MPPEECVVVEDAVSGIHAANAGGMAALGLWRAGEEQLLAAPSRMCWSPPWLTSTSTRWPKAACRQRGA